MNIYFCGIIGYSEARNLLEENRELCSSRLPQFFIKQFEELSSLHEAAKAEMKQLSNDFSVRVFPLGKGGLYRGLWALGEELGCGLNADILKVPVKQEVVEIMEILGEDPYEADSEGCFLLVSDDNIPAAYIGHTTSSRARIVKMPEVERFLTPPVRQDKDMAVKKTDRAGH